MNLRELIVSPTDGGSLAWEVSHDGSGHVRTGGGESFRVVGGIPRFVPDDDFAESFGFQWNLFEVLRKEEDEATFEVKTGVQVASLAGKTVLDAGCGGGRYSRVVAEHGARVVAIDRSRAVDKAAELTKGLDVVLAQADLGSVPVPPASFDLVFSIGVLHHGPDPYGAFRRIAAAVKPGGRLSVWLYRRNSLPQEAINTAARAVARRLPRKAPLAASRVGAFIGGIPIAGQAFSKVLNVSTHPDPALRLCDTFDWYSPQYQSHHTPAEIRNWFVDADFEEIHELAPAKSGRIYRAMFHRGLIPGSGVNITGLRR